MKTELIPHETPFLIYGKISEWLQEQPETPIEELATLIAIRPESGGIDSILMVSPAEYEIAFAFFVNTLLMVGEPQDISTRLAEAATQSSREEGPADRYLTWHR